MDASRLTRPSQRPHRRTNPLSALFFWWTWKIFREGLKQDFTYKDLHGPNSKDQSQYLGDKLERQWQNRMAAAAEKNTVPSLFRTIVSVFGLQYAKLALLLMAQGLIVSAVQPMLLGLLLSYFQASPSSPSSPSSASSDEAKRWAYVHAGGLFAVTAASSLLHSHYTLGAWKVGMRVRIACCSLLYRKALRLSQTAQGLTAAGQVVNLLSNDVSRFEKVSIFLHYLWLSPLITAIVGYLMYAEVGWPALAGMGAVLASVPLQGYVSKVSARLRTATALRTDARIRLVDDIVSGVRVIKMYAWERPFAQLMQAARKHEVKTLTWASYIRGLYTTLSLCTTRTAFFCTMIIMAVCRESLTAKKVFVLQSYFNVLSVAISRNLVRAMAEVAEVCVSIKRLQSFMTLQELTEEDRSRRRSLLQSHEDLKKQPLPFAVLQVLKSSPEEFSVVMDGVCASWDPRFGSPTLDDVNLWVKKGDLVAIVGPVGSGKSSLLQALLGELPASAGSVVLRGAVSFASQEPWVFASTLRQNVLFGLPFQAQRYEAVLRACVLDREFARLPLGDQTPVGESGVSLSGGQKARLNLARAVYKEADVYLLDDPLAALDPAVAHRLFRRCVLTFLKGKTRIIVTNQLQHVHRPDLLVMMDHGNACVVQGSPRPLTPVNEEPGRSSSISGSEDESPKKEPKRKKERDKPCEVAMEASSKGRIGGRSVYKEYLLASGSPCATAAVALLFLLTQLLACAVDYFVSLWTTHQELKAKYRPVYNLTLRPIEGDLLEPATIEEEEVLSKWEIYQRSVDEDQDLYIIIYASLIVGLFILALVRSLAFFNICMKSSINLHEQMFQSVIRATVVFFNNTPTGRILNRFSKDMGAVDEVLPRTMLTALQIVIQMIGSIIVAVLVNYYFAVPVVVLGTLFWLSRHVYLKTSNNLKRLEGTTKSPVFTHFHASMKGLSTVRAYGAQAVLCEEFDNHQDLHTATWYTFLVTSTAFGFFLDMFVCGFIAAVAFGSLALEGAVAGVLGGHPGLALTQAMALCGMLQWGVRQTAEVANHMMSVERIVEYTCLPPEPNLEGFYPDSDWPARGTIQFINVNVRHNEEDDPAIQDLNLTIMAGQKVGVVGRSGAGKSSLAAALFRLCRSLEGAVLVDGVDTATVPLQELRRRISVIPQDPLLFAGTMRQNLDPFRAHSDAQLLRVLQEVELGAALHPLGELDTRVAEGGRSLSAGQRQLVCLARAVLTRNRILVMDEATANVDHDTDALIQKTIRAKFEGCTIITVAHRLETVMDYDRILVVDAGKAVEFDHPYVLLQDPRSRLYKMVFDRPTATSSHHLFERARQSYALR